MILATLANIKLDITNYGLLLENKPELQLVTLEIINTYNPVQSIYFTTAYNPVNNL